MTYTALAAALSDRPFVFYECGICGHYHPAKFDGDCRDDANRYGTNDLPEGWEEVDSDDPNRRWRW